MTPLPRHVVLDLLPLYLAGELGAETAALVDAYLATDRELSEYVRANAADKGLGLARGGPLDSLELQSVTRTRAMLGRQRWLFGLGIGFAAVGLSTSVTIVNGRPTNVHLLLFDSPVPFGLCLVLAVVCWLAYSRLRR